MRGRYETLNGRLEWPAPWVAWLRTARTISLGVAVAAAAVIGIGASMLVTVESEHRPLAWFVIATGAILAAGAILSLESWMNAPRRTVDTNSLQLIRLDDKTRVTFIRASRVTIWRRSSPYVLGSAFHLNVALTMYSLQTGWAVTGVLLGLAAALLTPVVGSLACARRRMGIGLAPDGVYHLTRIGCFSYPWCPVEAGKHLTLHLLATHVEPTDTPAGRTPGGRTSLRRVIGANIRLEHLAINPALVLNVMAFYARSPDLRQGLGTESSVERILNIDLPYRHPLLDPDFKITTG